MRYSSYFWTGLILLAAFALRLFRLGWNSLWYDETVSLFLARQDLVSLTRHTAGDIHPPLYYYLLHFWGGWAGWSEFSAAFLSLVFGILLIALTYRLACEWFSCRVGLIAALLVALSPYNLWYSQEVRMYTLGAVLAVGSVFFFVRMLMDSETEPGAVLPRISREMIAYAVVSALGLYTLYYFAFLLIFENLVALVWVVLSAPPWALDENQAVRNSGAQVRTWLVSQVAILILYAPWIPIALRQAIDPPVPPWRSFTPFPTALLESFSALALGQSINPDQVLPVLVLIAALIGIALASAPSRRKGTVQPGFLLGYIVVPFLLIMLFSVWKPLYHVRYLFIYSPAFYLLLAVGIERVGQWRLAPQSSSSSSRAARLGGAALVLSTLGVITIASAASWSNFWFDPRYTEDDLRGAVQRIAALWRPGDAILLDAGYTYTAFAYYYDQPVSWQGRLIDYAPGQDSADKGAIVLQTGSIGGATSLGWGNPESDFYATTAEASRAALDRVFATHPRIWLLRLYDTVVDPNGIIRDYLTLRGRIFDDTGLAGESFARVQGYLTPGAAVTELPRSASMRHVLFGGRTALLGFEPETASVHSGAPLDVNLYWQAAQPSNLDEHLFVGLYSQQGRLIAGRDELPLGNGLGTSRWSPGEILREPIRLHVPVNVPTGNYILQVALYNPLTNEPVAADPAEWVTADNQIRLTSVLVEN